MAKQFKQAPLPFTGQKRMFLKHFEQVLNENINGDGEGWTIVDAFGGSGLLSHTAKQLKPKARVIYNDFDDYAERLKHIDDINRLRRLISDAVGKSKTQQKLSSDVKERVVKIINNFNGFKDARVLSSWLLFSGQQVKTIEQLCKKDFWNCVRQSDYAEPAGYLDSVEVIKESFHTLLPRFYNDTKALFVLDPPYLCTRQESYKQDTYFDLIDFLRLVNITRPPYVFFSSTKSEFIRFIEYMQNEKVDNWETFDNCKRIAIKAAINKDGGYEDNLIYKF
ncbi:hypothetical protein H2512_10945 [Pasteurella multocida]|uniref:hypothetical protein n=1 Tax=Pasteurella multocida TaxID=747 RepID=UPI00292D0E82|nr:hypothetical protein [Pasteurella multocida]WNY73923.1 hypothetical protein H2512_10945 [Pasteurella multocida]HDR1911976.1 hypothetical protein [Pasteurella multocida]HDR1913222.1 hypothetical protein [Pasteurella multocida]